MNLKVVGFPESLLYLYQITRHYFPKSDAVLTSEAQSWQRVTGWLNSGI